MVIRAKYYKYFLSGFPLPNPVYPSPLAHTCLKDDLSHINHKFTFITLRYCGPDSSVSIATVYGLDGPRIESQ